MVKIHQARGFTVTIYLDDDEPAHVHVWRAGGCAKVNLQGPAGQPILVWARGLSRADVRRAMAIVTEHRDAFLATWEGIHG